MSLSLPPWLLPLLLLLALLVGGWRAWRARRGARWLGFVLLLQLGVSLVLWQLLRAPAPAPAATALIVLTANHGLPTDDPQALTRALAEYPSAAAYAEASVSALPEAGSLPLGEGRTLQAVPDLATALRLWPARRLLIIGDGLQPRDLPAIRSLALDWQPPGQLEGVTDLQLPPPTPVAQDWVLRGQLSLPQVAANDHSLWQLRLLDPAGTSVDQVPLSADGRFELRARTPVAGRHDYRLQWRDAAQAVGGELVVPVQIVQPSPLRLAIQAGAPSPELKFLRRWAMDAGLLQQSQIAMRPNLRLRGGEAINGAAAEDWQQTDLLIIDDRTWRDWPESRRASARSAVAAGIGLLLRQTGTLDRIAGERLAELGFQAETAEISRQLRLASPARQDCDAPSSEGKDAADPVASGRCLGLGQLDLQRRPLRVQADPSVPLLQASDGEPLGLWHPLGQGRVGMLWLSDSHRIALMLGPAEHATLWAGLAGTLARAQGTVQNDPRSLEPAWVGQRLTVCGGWGQVRDPTGDTTDLLASTDRPDCAGWWPRRAGWHALLPELDSTQAERWRYVRAAEDAPSLWRASIQRQMAAQVATAPTATDSETSLMFR